MCSIWRYSNPIHGKICEEKQWKRKNVFFEKFIFTHSCKRQHLTKKWLLLSHFFGVNHRTCGVQPSDFTIFSPILLKIIYTFVLCNVNVQITWIIWNKLKFFEISFFFFKFACDSPLPCYLLPNYHLLFSIYTQLCTFFTNPECKPHTLDFKLSPCSEYCMLSSG